MQQIIPCCRNFLLFKKKTSIMRQLANRIAHWNLYTGFRLLILPVACVLAHWSPVIECLFVPHLEMRSWPLLAAYTSSEPCYCSGCIPEALLTYSSPYSAENIPRHCPFTAGITNLQCYFVRMSSYNAVLSGCQTIKSCIQTQQGETLWVWREFNCYLRMQNISFSVFALHNLSIVSYDFY